MYIKNALRLMINNLTCCYKTMLYRLIVVVVFFCAAYWVVYFGASAIVNSVEMKAVLEDFKQIWLQFIGIDFSAPVELNENFKELFLLVETNMLRIILSLIGLVVIIFFMSWSLGLCNFTVAEMINRHMSTITKAQFIPTFLQSFKRAAVFELFFTVLKSLVAVICIGVFLGIVLLTGRTLSLLSVILALWVVICIVSLFYALTTTLRPKVVDGMKLKDALKSTGVPREKFSTVFATYVLGTVLIVYVNVTMFIATFGAGLMVSVPLSFLFLICVQAVVYYTHAGRKYYIDFDTIIVPKQLRSEDEQLLDDVDM